MSQHDNQTHKSLLDYIRRANLDAFWSHTQLKLYHLARIFSEEVTTGQSLEFQMFPTSPGPFPTYYDGGLRSALGVLSVHANIYMASDSGGSKSQVIRSVKGLQVMASDPTNSKWFTRFMNGLPSSIGERRNQDATISIALIIETQRLLELEWHMVVNKNDKEHIRTVDENGSFHIFTYCGSLRGMKPPKFYSMITRKA